MLRESVVMFDIAQEATEHTLPGLFSRYGSLGTSIVDSFRKHLEQLEEAHRQP